MPSTSYDEALARLALLDDPTRRRVYTAITERSPAEMSRDETALALGISRSLAAFHLDRLVEAGLLEASYRRLGKRAGPGAGRPAKLYRRSPAEIEVSLPPRDYSLAGSLMAAALSEDEGARSTLDRLAREFGRGLGEEARRRAGGRPGQRALTGAFLEVLTEHGFEPVPGKGEVRLRNCPFHLLSQQFPAVLCGMNLELMKGLTEELGARALTPRLEPAPGMCCVSFGREPAAPADR